LFWKKKKGRAKDLPFALELEQDRREHYRVEPRPDQPLSVEVGSRRIPVIDISAGGVAFKAGGAKPGQRFRARLTLPNAPAPLDTVLEAVKSVPGKLTACSFHQIDSEGRELVHQYVLRRQKEELEKRRQEKLLEAEQEGPPKG